MRYKCEMLRSAFLAFLFFALASVGLSAQARDCPSLAVKDAPQTAMHHAAIAGKSAEMPCHDMAMPAAPQPDDPQEPMPADPGCCCLAISAAAPSLAAHDAPTVSVSLITWAERGPLDPDQAPLSTDPPPPRA